MLSWLCSQAAPEGRVMMSLKLNGQCLFFFVLVLTQSPNCMDSDFTLVVVTAALKKLLVMVVVLPSLHPVLFSAYDYHWQFGATQKYLLYYIWVPVSLKPGVLQQHRLNGLHHY